MVTIKQLEKAVGGLSKPSKMPELSYGLPADDCITGSILRTKCGSVCSKCYAKKGCYVFPVVQSAQRRRVATLAKLEAWRVNMTLLLARKYRNRERVFRWHDSGDIQSMEHLRAIVQIARDLSDIRFWLPTKERGFVRRLRSIPSNLVIRVSAPMIGQTAKALRGTVSSTVGAGVGFACTAYKRNGECGTCRACWKKSVKSVDYPQH